MKYTSILLIFFVVACSHRQEPRLHLNQSATVLFSFQNVTDSLKLRLYTLPVITTSKFDETVFISGAKNHKSFAIPCENPTAVYFFIANKGFTGYIQPRDTLKVFVGMKNRKQVEHIYFEGSTQKICDYYLKKKQKLNYHDLRIPLNRASSDSKDILQNTDSLMRQELQFLTDYTSESELPQWFIETEKNQIIYLCNDFKLSRESYCTRFLDIPFNPEPEYYHSMDTLQLNNPEAVFSYWYFYYLKDYLVYKRVSGKGLSPKQWVDKSTATALVQAKKYLSGEVRDIFCYSFLNSYLRRTKNLDDFDRLLKKHKDDFTNKYYLDDLLVERNALTDSIVQNRNDDYRPVVQNKIKQNDSIPYFYLPDTNGEFYSPADFKEDLVYISFWATWCKPCIKGIPAKNKLIGEFEHHTGVKFLNICISSEKDSWQKFTTEKEMKGINLFANQNWSDILKQKYGVNAIPTYFIIDRGVIVKPYCDSPETVADDIELVLAERNEPFQILE